MITQSRSLGPSGTYAVSKFAGESVESFVPNSLADLKENLDLTPILPQLAAAERALGRLDGVSSILPNTPLFLYMYVRKEALLSVQLRCRNELRA